MNRSQNEFSLLDEIEVIKSRSLFYYFTCEGIYRVSSS